MYRPKSNPQVVLRPQDLVVLLLSVRVQKYPGLRVEIYPGVLAACHAVGEWQV